MALVHCFLEDIVSSGHGSILPHSIFEGGGAAGFLTTKAQRRLENIHGSWLMENGEEELTKTEEVVTPAMSDKHIDMA
jgi:hypothetical protein